MEKQIINWNKKKNLKKNNIGNKTIRFFLNILKAMSI